MGSDETNENKNNESELIEIKEEAKYIWIDPEIENEENKFHYEHIFKEKKIDCKKFDNIDNAFNYIKEENNFFKEIIIIISGKLFNNFYHKITQNIKLLKFSPTIMIFTKKKNMCINQLKMNNIYYNNDLFDAKMIITRPKEINDFIENNFVIEQQELTFDIIEDLEQLIIPNYYTYLLENVSKSEINYFNDYLIRNFLMHIDLTKEGKYRKGIKEMSKLINQIKYKKLPKEILIKYWIRIYSLNTKYFYNINKSLRYKDEQAYFYYPFIKLCYEGIKKNFIQSYTKIIYRYSLINKKEFDEINVKFNTCKNKEKKNDFPNIIVFTKSFLSFSMDKDKIEIFKKSGNDNSYSVLYVIEEIKNGMKKIISNADIDEFSFYPNEKEVLVFPFTCFEIADIVPIKDDEELNYEIHLKYLGNYSEYIEEQFGTNFFDRLQISNYSEELMNSGIVKIQNFFSTWIDLKKFKIKVDKICFFFEDNEDFVCFNNEKIFIYNKNTSKLKQEIIIHQDKILNIIDIKRKKICSYSKDMTIKIIELIESNQKFKLINAINLEQNYITQILFFKHDFLCVDSLNNLLFFKFEKEQYNNYIKLNEEKDNILIMKQLDNEPNGNDNTFVYICENKEGNKIVKFFKFSNREEKMNEYNSIKIEDEQNKKSKLIDLLVFYDCIIICFNTRIVIINYKEEQLKIKSFNFFDYEIINIIILSSNRIILELYDSEKNESYIREHLLRIEDLQNNIDRFDCIGQGILESKKIDNIIKINESQILINVKNDSLIIYERKNEVSVLLKQNLNLININNKEIIENNRKDKNEIKITEKNNINNYFSKNESFEIKRQIRHSVTTRNNYYNLNQNPFSNNPFNNNQINNINIYTNRQYNNNIKNGFNNNINSHSFYQNKNQEYFQYSNYSKQNSFQLSNYNTNPNSNLSHINESLNLNKFNNNKTAFKKINNQVAKIDNHNQQNLKEFLPEAYNGKLVDNKSKSCVKNYPRNKNPIYG